jgi:hypothetical protein
MILIAAIILAVANDDATAASKQGSNAQIQLQVATDFEGGSARVESIDQVTHTIRFFPAGDPHRGWPCWWSLRVDGAPKDGQVTFELAPSPVIAQEGPTKGKQLPGSWAMPDRAALSTNGTIWAHTAPGKKRDGRMIYEVTAGSSTFWLAWGPPFTPKDAAAIVQRIAGNMPSAESIELCQTRERHTVPALRVCEGERSVAERYGVWIHARQHAWESGSSWVCRGFIEWLTSSEESAIWLRRHGEFIVVPVMDIDHVATGDGGKEAIPQDHNRDWSDAPHWPEVATAQQRLRAWADQGRLDVFIDLHNPGPGDQRAFFYVGPDDMLAPQGRRNRSRFLELAAAEITGPIPLADQPKQSGPGYHPLWKQMSGNWVTAHGNPHTLSICLETAWNTPGSTTEGYLAVGAQLGRALEKYLRQNPRRMSP